ncbi:MAG: hypothetical protein QNI84_01515 [Henriciella sp.]|nr:hypothetical protein [Henriciella sp.]
MTTQSSKTRGTFAYVHTTEHGTVLISENVDRWWQIYFEERWSGDHEVELLGTYPSVGSAIEAARSGLVDTPEIGVDLKDMDLPEDPNQWLQHRNRLPA